MQEEPVDKPTEAKGHGRTENIFSLAVSLWYLLLAKLSISSVAKRRAQFHSCQAGI
jgi:hypothetical protein